MKIKLTLENTAKLEIACKVIDATILDRKKYGKKTVVLLNVRKPADLYELGKIEESITVEDVMQEEKNKLEASDLLIKESEPIEKIQNAERAEKKK